MPFYSVYKKRNKKMVNNPCLLDIMQADEKDVIESSYIDETDVIESSYSDEKNVIESSYSDEKNVIESSNSNDNCNEFVKYKKDKSIPVIESTFIPKFKYNTVTVISINNVDYSINYIISVFVMIVLFLISFMRRYINHHR